MGRSKLDQLKALGTTERPNRRCRNGSAFAPKPKGSQRKCDDCRFTEKRSLARGGYRFGRGQFAGGAGTLPICLAFGKRLEGQAGHGQVAGGRGFVVVSWRFDHWSTQDPSDGDYRRTGTNGTRSVLWQPWIHKLAGDMDLNILIRTITACDGGGKFPWAAASLRIVNRRLRNRKRGIKLVVSCKPSTRYHTEEEFPNVAAVSPRRSADRFWFVCKMELLLEYGWKRTTSTLPKTKRCFLAG